MITAGTTGTSRSWRGVIRVDKKVVWTCDHIHRNRDHGSRSAGRAACECARSVLKYALMDSAELEQYKADVRQYMKPTMTPIIPWSIDYELSVRDAVRRSIGLMETVNVE